MTAEAKAKLERVKALLRGCGRVLVAYSGGVDSAFLAKIAYDVLGDKMLAVIADTPSLPRRELRDALELGKRFGFSVRVIKTSEMENASYTSNPPDRCYFCKTELFEKTGALAKAEGGATIVYGANADDTGDFRPGSNAAAKFGVRAPLQEAGLTKSEIRAFSALLGLPTAEKPAMACLSSRIPYGDAVSVEALAMVEAAEDFLRDRGFRDVRVRHHRTLARIEVAVPEMFRLLETGMREEVCEELKRIGYAYVALDLRGYRQGSLNEVLASKINSQ